MATGEPATDDAVTLTVTIPGTPRPQGSLRLIRATAGHEVAHYPEHVIEHRNTVALALKTTWADREPYAGPVTLDCLFTMPRPKAHYGTGKNSGRLKPGAPAHHAQMPDADKLTRLICDALVAAGVLIDDCQITTVRGRKQWGERGSTTIHLDPVIPA